MPEMAMASRAECLNGDDPPNPLSLPVLLPSAVCHDSSVSDVLLEHEFCLRKAQAYDALTDLWDYLEVLNYLDGQLDGTEQPVDAGLSILANLMCVQIRVVVERYRTAYHALSELAGALRKENWRECLQRLDDEHLQCLPDYSNPSDTHSTLQVRPWIWQLSSTPFVGSHNVRNPSVSITLHHGE